MYGFRPIVILTYSEGSLVIRGGSFEVPQDDNRTD
jgi:hypothetical protein